MNDMKFKIALDKAIVEMSRIEIEQKEKCKQLVIEADTDIEAIAITHGYNLGRKSMYELAEVYGEILKEALEL